MTFAISSAELLAEFRQAIRKISDKRHPSTRDSGSFYPASSPAVGQCQEQLDLLALKTAIATLVHLDSRGRISHEFSEEDLSATEKARELSQDSDAVGAPLAPIDASVFTGTSEDKQNVGHRASREFGRRL